MSVRVRENKRRGWLMVDIRIRLPDGTRYREREGTRAVEVGCRALGRGARALPLPAWARTTEEGGTDDARFRAALAR